MFERLDEREQFAYFRRAYKHATGQWLTLVRKSERPDFICHRPDGHLVGVEFTVITRDPESSDWESILENKEYMDGYDAFLEIGYAVERKGNKRREKDWQLPNSSILVLSTADCSISEIEKHIDDDFQADCQESGFSEIWIADHTEIDAYGTIELFGIVPKDFFKTYSRPWTGKPYG